MASVTQLLPELHGEEMMFVQSLINELDDEKAQVFANAYRARRKDPQTILLLAAIGFVGFAGAHRFVLDQILLGILFFLTAGFCFLGTIVDMVNYQKLTFEYNSKVAREITSTMAY